MVGARQLRQFVVVAEELNFRRAAQRLHMSQPPLTQAIKRLEGDLGVRLFERDRSFVRLTTAGEVLLEHARQALLHHGRMIDAVRQADLGITGTLCVSFVPSASLLSLPPVVQGFRTRYPGVSLELLGDTSARQLVALEQQRVHLSIVVGPLPASPHLAVTPLQRAPFVAAVPVDHPLAQRQRIALRDLADQSFVQLPMAQAPAYTATIFNACQNAGFTPRIVQEAAPIQTVLTLVGCGAGVSLVPASMQVLALPTVKYLALTDSPAPAYELAVARLAGTHHELAERFVSALLAALGPQASRPRRGPRGEPAPAPAKGRGQHTAARLSRRGSEATT